MNVFVRTLLINLLLLLVLALLHFRNFQSRVYTFDFASLFLLLAAANIGISIILAIARKKDAKIFLLYGGIIFLIGFSLCTMSFNNT
jgi:hypothetical protein